MKIYWICADCAAKSLGERNDHEPTWCVGICSVCKCERAVAEPSDIYWRMGRPTLEEAQKNLGNQSAKIGNVKHIASVKWQKGVGK